MNQSDDQSICDDAEAHALGILDGPERQRFEVHLAGRCDRCAALLADYKATIGVLGAAATPIRTPANLDARIRSRLAHADQPRRELTGFEFILGEDRGWIDSGIDGVEFRLLAEDVSAGRRTFLTRMRDGASLPRHRHVGVEEIYLIEGHLEVSGVDMQSGDYCRADPDTIHESVTSRGGCVFLVSASTDDEVLLHSSS
jgi:anti-sigma factor ChrR (cupin superfamily)